MVTDDHDPASARGEASRGIVHPAAPAAGVGLPVAQRRAVGALARASRIVARLAAAAAAPAGVDLPGRFPELARRRPLPRAALAFGALAARPAVGAAVAARKPAAATAARAARLAARRAAARRAQPQRRGRAAGRALAPRADHDRVPRVHAHFLRRRQRSPASAAAIVAAAARADQKHIQRPRRARERQRPAREQLQPPVLTPVALSVVHQLIVARIRKLRQPRVHAAANHIKNHCFLLLSVNTYYIDRQSLRRFGCCCERQLSRRLSAGPHRARPVFLKACWCRTNNYRVGGCHPRHAHRLRIWPAAAPTRAQRRRGRALAGLCSDGAIERPALPGVERPARSGGGQVVGNLSWSCWPLWSSCACSSFRTLRARGSGSALWTLRPCGPRVPFRPLRTCFARLALGSLRPRSPGITFWSRSSRFSLGSLGPCVTFRTF